MNDVCVCVLAYNEEKRIADTIRAILTGNGEMSFEVVVYANGCTDKTADAVRALSKAAPAVRLRELTRASKPNAWNTAFAENTNRILFFSDGDVSPEPGSVAALYRYLEDHPDASMVCSQAWPDVRGLSLEKHLTGFLQIPLIQDFHTGGFYAIRRSRLWSRFQEKGIQGIPEGVVGEDEFLGLLVPRKGSFVARQKVLFQPPTFAEYWKYLARLRWQEEQLFCAYGELLADEIDARRGTRRSRLIRKLTAGQSPTRLLVGATAAALRAVVKLVCRRRIERCYRSLGPVRSEGGSILSQHTRSESAR